MIQSFNRPETVEARGNRPLDTILVPTRVDPSELDDLANFQVRFERIAKEKVTRPEVFKRGSLFQFRREPTFDQAQT